MSIDLTDLIIGIITVIFGIVMKYLVPYIKSKTNEQTMNEVKTWVKIAVQAAEMIYREKGLGTTKKAYVSDFLYEKGFTFNADEIDNLIESAVLELKLME